MIILGSTGSIGVNTLIIAKKFSLHVEVLVCGKNIELLNEQIAEFHPTTVVISDKEDAQKMRIELMAKNKKAMDRLLIDLLELV